MGGILTTGNGAAAASPPRYLFDEVFAYGTAAPAGQTCDAAPSEELVAEARREGFEAGLAEGRQAAVEDQSARLCAAVRALCEQLTAANENAEQERRQIQREAAGLAIAAARKLAPALVARQPLTELEAILRDCLFELRDAPHLAIRLAPELVEPMREKLEPLHSQTGFAGQIVVLADPEIAPGDGRIDWADGGILRDSGAMEQALDVALARYLGSAEISPSEEPDNG